jgi:competence ComEA-like helix-hairpin-helix protein
MAGGIFTREERAVVLFLVASLSIGCGILGARKFMPEAIPDFSLPADESEGQRGRNELEGPVDINVADADQLTALPGVGPARAAAIVALRERRGAFSSVDDLLEVKGIGPVILERMRSMAKVGKPGAPDDSSSTAASRVDDEAGRGVANHTGAVAGGG